MAAVRLITTANGNIEIERKTNDKIKDVVNPDSADGIELSPRFSKRALPYAGA